MLCFEHKIAPIAGFFMKKPAIGAVSKMFRLFCLKNGHFGVFESISDGILRFRKGESTSHIERFS
jgi:hypothetical protein